VGPKTETAEAWNCTAHTVTIPTRNCDEIGKTSHRMCSYDKTEGNLRCQVLHFRTCAYAKSIFIENPVLQETLKSKLKLTLNVQMVGYRGLCSNITGSQTINGKHSSADVETAEKWHKIFQTVLE
jgi:hypothetical protein